MHRYISCKIFVTVFLIAVTSVSCGNNGKKPAAVPADTLLPYKRIPDPENYGSVAKDNISPDGKRLDSMGLIDILDIDPTLVVKLVYATPDNFMGEILYKDLREAYLLPEAAAMLARAHQNLKNVNSGYRLVVYDAARPMSVQRKMRELAVRQGKQYYVANPANGGGLHNYGAAVDVSVIDADGNLLPMGTDYDHLGFEANIDKEQELARSGHITEQELQNRLLLRRAMSEAGFRTVASEWWHFNFCSREEAVRRYTLIDF